MVRNIRNIFTRADLSDQVKTLGASSLASHARDKGKGELPTSLDILRG